MATWLVWVLVAWALLAALLAVLVGRALRSLTDGSGGAEAQLQPHPRAAGAGSGGSRVELGRPG